MTTIPGLEGLEGVLIPRALLIREYFSGERKELEDLEAIIENIDAQMKELLEEHGGEDGLLANAVDEKGKISKGSLGKAIKEAQETVKVWRKKKPAVVPIVGPGKIENDKLDVLMLRQMTGTEHARPLPKTLMDEEMKTQEAKKIKSAKSRNWNARSLRKVPQIKH